MSWEISQNFYENKLIVIIAPKPDVSKVFMKTRTAYEVWFLIKCFFLLNLNIIIIAWFS